MLFRVLGHAFTIYAFEGSLSSEAAATLASPACTPAASPGAGGLAMAIESNCWQHEDGATETSTLIAFPAEGSCDYYYHGNSRIRGATRGEAIRDSAMVERASDEFGLLHVFAPAASIPALDWGLGRQPRVFEHVSADMVEVLASVPLDELDDVEQSITCGVGGEAARAGEQATAFRLRRIESGGGGGGSGGGGGGGGLSPPTTTLLLPEASRAALAVIPAQFDLMWYGMRARDSKTRMERAWHAGSVYFWDGPTAAQCVRNKQVHEAEYPTGAAFVGGLAPPSSASVGGLSAANAADEVALIRDAGGTGVVFR